MSASSLTGSRFRVDAIPALRLLLVVSIVGPALLFAGAAWEERRILMEEAAKRADKSAEVLEEHTEAAFQSYKLVFARIEEHLQANPNEDDAGRHAYLAAIDRELKEVDSVFLIEADGRVSVHSRFFPFSSVNVSDRDYFRMLAAQQEHATNPPSQATELPSVGLKDTLAIGKPVIGRLSGTTKLNIARALSTPDGRFAGAIVISVGQGYFEAFQRKLAASSGDSMALIRSDGVTLARSPPLTNDDVRRLADPQAGRDMIERLSLGSVRFISALDHVERIASYRRLADYPIFVGYGLSTASVLATWRENLLIYAALAMLAGLALSGVVWLALRAVQRESRAQASLVGEMRRREAAEATLRQVQKMEAVGQLTGGIAHDFNNLLAAILGNLELLAKRLPDDPRLRRYVAGALEGTRRGAGLTRRMLAFARRQDLKTERVDVSRLVADMSELMERTIGPTIAIATHFPAGLPAARADANQLEASLLNLVVNARDAMPRGGRITIMARESAIAANNPLPLSPGAYVVLTVVDTGTGMTPETLARATEPFFTTKPVGKGTGLGLAMVHGFATQSGGTLRIETVVGEGTAMEIWLPVDVSDAPAPASEPPEASPGAEPHIHVLLVDDDPLVLEGTSAMLEDLGHRVSAASSGRAALDVLRTDAGIDAMITDYAMPGINGLELAKMAAAQHPRLSILLASGYADLSVEDEARLLRLAKPFTQAALRQAVSALANESAAARNLSPA